MSRRQLICLDAIVAAAYTLLLLAEATGRPTPDGLASGFGSGLTLAGSVSLVLPLAMGLPLAARRLWPRRVFAVVLIASILALVLGVVRDGFVGAGYALYLVARTERPPRREATLAVAALSAVGALLLVGGGAPVPPSATLMSILVGVVALGGAWAMGRAVAERHELAGQAAAQIAERAMTEERLRIARDLHDIVAHGLSLIVVEAGTARHVMAARPERASEALEIIESTGRTTLVEMRRMLGVLRAGEDRAADSDLAPAPGLAELRALAAGVAGAGVRVELEVQALPNLPAGLAVSIYRIVQEALTNVVKHAAPASCRVVISADATTIRIEVVDDGLRGTLEPRAAGPMAARATAVGSDVGSAVESVAGRTIGSTGGAVVEAGHGLIGMRERVRALGGRLEAGPGPQRGFRVVVSIPRGG